MHKRAYIRTSQEVRPWRRVFIDRRYDHNELTVFGKKTLRWTAGERRDRETRILNAWRVAEKRKTLLYIFKNNHFLFNNMYKIKLHVKDKLRKTKLKSIDWNTIRIFKWSDLNDRIKKRRQFRPLRKSISIKERLIVKEYKNKQIKNRRWLIVRRSTLLYQKFYKLGRLHSKARSKNTCLFIGKGSTFNRQLFISRQTLRKLTRFGLVSGLISGKKG